MKNSTLPADIDRILATEDEIEKSIQRLAAQISQDYAGKEVLLIGILKGAFIFLADLSRHLTISHSVDFMSLSSYGATATTSGEVRIMQWEIEINCNSRQDTSTESSGRSSRVAGRTWPSWSRFPRPCP